MAGSKDFYVICDNIRSLENIGSIFRTADAAGVTKLFLCGISGLSPHHKFSKNLVWEQAILHPKIAKTALGAEKLVPFEYYAHTWRLIEQLKKVHVHIVALEQGEKSILYTKFKPQFPLALVIGNEVKGISKKTLAKADEVVHLPMRGKKESLNVAVAFGIASYYMRSF